MLKVIDALDINQPKLLTKTMASQSPYPEFAHQAPSSVNKFKVRIAIDFGTDGVGT